MAQDIAPIVRAFLEKVKTDQRARNIINRSISEAAGAEVSPAIFARDVTEILRLRDGEFTEADVDEFKRILNEYFQLMAPVNWELVFALNGYHSGPQ